MQALAENLYVVTFEQLSHDSTETCWRVQDVLY